MIFHRRSPKYLHKLSKSSSGLTRSALRFFFTLQGLARTCLDVSHKILRSSPQKLFNNLPQVPQNFLQNLPSNPPEIPRKSSEDVLQNSSRSSRGFSKSSSFRSFGVKRFQFSRFSPKLRRKIIIIIIIYNYSRNSSEMS